MPWPRLSALLAIGMLWSVSWGCQRPAAQSAGAPTAAAQLPAVASQQLRAPQAFQVFSNPAQRAQGLFLEASRVLLHPRCVNCHPSGESPLQREGGLHDPPVLRGPEDRGVVGMECTSCHQDRNLELARVPGAPNWHLAPASMAWAGRDPSSLCEQLKDPARNGGKSLPQIVEHSAHDALVAWGWAPGSDREPAPGSQAEFGALVAAWVEAGAACPAPGAATAQRGAD
jgi:hypothetical protein